MSEQTSLVPKKASPTKALKNYLTSENALEHFVSILGEQNAGAYIGSVLTAVAESEALQKCKFESIYITAIRAASLRLSVDPGSGQAYLVPYGGKCTLIVGWRGLKDMAIRTGKYRYITTSEVYEGEEITVDRKTGEIFWKGGPTSPKTIKGWYAAFGLIDGFEKQIYMSLEEIHEHAEKYSPSYHRKDGPWTQFKEAMERKTVLRKLLRDWGYLDPVDAQLLNRTETEDDIEYLDAPMVEDEMFLEAPKKPLNPIMSRAEIGGEITEDEFYQCAEQLGLDEDLAMSVAMGCKHDYTAATLGLKKQLPPEE